MSVLLDMSNSGNKNEKNQVKMIGFDKIETFVVTVINH